MTTIRDPELREAFDRAHAAWARWKHRPPARQMDLLTHDDDREAGWHRSRENHTTSSGSSTPAPLAPLCQQGTQGGGLSRKP